MVDDHELNKQNLLDLAHICLVFRQIIEEKQLVDDEKMRVAYCSKLLDEVLKRQLFMNERNKKT